MKTLKELKASKTARVTRIFTGQWHADNHAEFVEFLRKQITENNPGMVFELRVSVAGNSVRWLENGKDTGHYWYLPKLKKEVTGVVEFRSADYRFLADGADEYSYGTQLKAGNLTDYGFAIDYPDGSRLEYHIEKKG